MYIAFNTAALVFTWVSSFGLLAVLRCLMRGGLLRSRDAAPPEAIEKNTEVVELTEAQLAETPACAICSADFGAGGAPVAKAAACGHVFHKPCLQKWMAMARSCFSAGRAPRDCDMRRSARTRPYARTEASGLGT